MVRLSPDLIKGNNTGSVDPIMLWPGNAPRSEAQSIHYSPLPYTPGSIAGISLSRSPPKVAVLLTDFPGYAFLQSSDGYLSLSQNLDCYEYYRSIISPFTRQHFLALIDVVLGHFQNGFIVIIAKRSNPLSGTVLVKHTVFPIHVTPRVI